MIETARLSYTSAMEYMGLPIDEFILFRQALNNVLERDIEARNAARNE